MTLPEPGDVVVCRFPGVAETKRRPAVVRSSVEYQATRPDVIMGILTTAVAGEQAGTDHVLMDWRDANLRRPSTFRAFIVTGPQTTVISRVGRLTDRDWQAVRECVNRALATSGPCATEHQAG